MRLRESTTTLGQSWRPAIREISYGEKREKELRLKSEKKTILE